MYLAKAPMVKKTIKPKRPIGGKCFDSFLSDTNDSLSPCRWENLKKKIGFYRENMR